MIGPHIRASTTQAAAAFVGGNSALFSGLVSDAAE
jgi:hypothetical protein